MTIRLPVIAAFILALLTPPLAASELGDLELEAEFSPELDTRDREGLWRDTKYFLAYQWVVVGLLYIAPESVSGWTDEQKKDYSMSRWWDNVTSPQWDSDQWYINYVAHPYFGGAYYVRARERGYDDEGAFWYSFLLSCLFEFGVEALAEEVSIQDHFVTPIGGTLVGRYFMEVREGVREREAELGYRRTRDKWIWVLTDPLGEANNALDRAFGRDVNVQLRPYMYVSQNDALSSLAPQHLQTEPVYGIQFHIEW